MKKPCKECPWVVKNKHNEMITNHSIKHNKPHNCHMISPEKRGGLWDVKEETKCIGRKLYEHREKVSEY
jgi:hypothetical protein